jgi:hypothetical protein
LTSAAAISIRARAVDAVPPLVGEPD